MSGLNCLPAYFSQGAPRFRPNKAIYLCLLELVMPSLGARVKAAQKKFVLRLLSQHESITDDPFIVIWKICIAARTIGAKYL